jgi:hypothetical protein
VLAYDAATSDYRFSTQTDLLPPTVFFVRALIDADEDDDVELIAMGYDIDDPNPAEAHLAILDLQDGTWVDVQTRFPLTHYDVSEKQVWCKVIGGNGQKTTRFGTLSIFFSESENPFDWGFLGVSIVRVTSELEFVIDDVLEPGFKITDFESNDFDGDGAVDIVIGGRNDGGPISAVYLGDGEGWSEPKMYSVSFGDPLRTGDLTGDGIADVLVAGQPSEQIPVQAWIMPTEERFDVAQALWPVDVFDINADRQDDLVYRYTEGGAPAPLSVLLSKLD